MLITIRKLREWGVCSEGMEWFRDTFPEGADWETVLEKLKWADWRSWLLRKCAEHGSYAVRIKLVDCRNPDVRFCCAEFGSNAIRKKLINDKFACVRQACARCGSDAIRKKLINDRNSSVRFCCAKYGSDEVRMKLINDPDPDVQRVAKKSCRRTDYP